MADLEIPSRYVPRGYSVITNNAGQFAELVFVPEDGPDNPHLDANAIRIRMTPECYKALVRYVAKDGIPDIDWTALYNNLRAFFQEFDQSPGFAIQSKDPSFIRFAREKRTVHIKPGVEGYDIKVIAAEDDAEHWVRDQMVYARDVRDLADEIRAFLF